MNTLLKYDELVCVERYMPILLITKGSKVYYVHRDFQFTHAYNEPSLLVNENDY